MTATGDVGRPSEGLEGFASAAGLDPLSRLTASTILPGRDVRRSPIRRTAGEAEAPDGVPPTPAAAAAGEEDAPGTGPSVTGDGGGAVAAGDPPVPQQAGPAPEERRLSWRSLGRTRSRRHDEGPGDGAPALETTREGPDDTDGGAGPVPAGVTTERARPEGALPGPGSTVASPAPPATDPVASTVGAFRDEVMFATATLQTLVQTHRTELGALAAEVSLLRGTVAALRTELTAHVSALTAGRPAATGPVPAPSPARHVLVPADGGGESLAAPAPEPVPAPVPVEAPTVAEAVEPSRTADAAPPDGPDSAPFEDVPPAAPSPPRTVPPLSWSGPSWATPLESPLVPPLPRAVEARPAVPAAAPLTAPAPAAAGWKRPEPSPVPAPRAETAALLDRELAPDVVVEPEPAPVPAPERAPAAAAAGGTGAPVTTSRSAPDPAALEAAAARIGLPRSHVDLLRRWADHDGRAVIEIAHPGGRHRVGLSAIVHAVGTGRRVLVVMPDLDSAATWRASLAAHAPEIDVQVDGAGSRGSRRQVPDVLLTTPGHAGREGRHGFEPDALLVAVDAHRFGTSAMSRALDARSGWRLGLTEDYRGRGLARYVDDFFGGTVLSFAP